VLRHVSDLTESDIAAAMGVTRSTVSNTLHDAYRNLRDMLEASVEEKPDACTR
jgi:DNA-directed RNA polymerase specialized sigma24 family protein